MKDKDYDKMADAIVKKNAEYHNRIGSYACVALGIALLIAGIVMEIVFKKSFDVGSVVGYVCIGGGALLLIVGVIWLLTHRKNKKASK